MSDYDDFEEYEEIDSEITDPAEVKAKETIRDFFDKNQESVYFSCQIEVLHEKKYFHWVTNRAIRDLIAEGVVKEEVRKLTTKGNIKLLWHKNYRYYKRSANELVQLVEAYSNPNITGALGLQGEAMILEAFARAEFVMKGRNTQCFQEKCWTKNNKDIDFIFEKDSVAYGIEVKNTLGYMEQDELKEKTELCHHIGVI
ncbi:hypothetical protein IQ259_25705 [Fortiea sp. LEGE XX443]|uniref:hypothetical protein n=1 Tax=Fortiea sp. LEGE XX443 TaxID=1828611 RepID=UPI00187EFEE1|nr:hypothetical protein [Fortiea sp. LEGE XX443]MBE9008356.1 hypothetical protein [Fortiea sp. LEGE XX443]